MAIDSVGGVRVNLIGAQMHLYATSWVGADGAGRQTGCTALLCPPQPPSSRWWRSAPFRSHPNSITCWKHPVSWRSEGRLRLPTGVPNTVLKSSPCTALFATLCHFTNTQTRVSTKEDGMGAPKHEAFAKSILTLQNHEAFEIRNASNVVKHRSSGKRKRTKLHPQRLQIVFVCSWSRLAAPGHRFPRTVWLSGVRPSQTGMSDGNVSDGNVSDDCPLHQTVFASTTFKQNMCWPTGITETL
jgi:hypothetical protein